LLLGVTCGLLGGFMVVRRMALVGDALSHAVLPGVAVGFLWNMSRDPVAIFVGATVAGLIGTAFVSAITRTTRLKEDAALGLVLASFFAVGLCLLSVIQRLPSAQSAGLSHFLFGQAATIGPEDLRVMAVVAGVVGVFVLALYKELVAVAFDAAFARSQGLPAAAVHHAFMFLLAAAA
jgi:manganese/zinc/iron transport system permease protein